MKNFIVIDSGGSRTVGSLFNEQGTVLDTRVTGGANPNTVGILKAQEKIVSVINTLRQQAPTNIEGILISWAGITGYGDTLKLGLIRKTGINQIYTVSDIVPIIKGGLGNRDGACLISGTGSVCFVRIGDKLVRIGGWGYMLDASSSGSGFDLGRDAILAALHALDGQGEPTCLTELVNNHLGCDVRDAIPKIYAGNTEYIASFASLVFDGVRGDDKVSLDIMRRNCEGLSRMLFAATKFLKPPFDVILSGGILKNHSNYAEMLQELAPTGVCLKIMEDPILWGCAAELLCRLGISYDDRFKQCFIETFSLLP